MGREEGTSAWQARKKKQKCDTPPPAAQPPATSSQGFTPPQTNSATYSPLAPPPKHHMVGALENSSSNVTGEGGEALTEVQAVLLQIMGVPGGPGEAEM